MLLVMFVGCTSYPRYRAYTPATPKGETPEQDLLTPNEFMRLGSILQKYLGRPYRGKSRTAAGLDCSEFTQNVYREFNKTLLPRTVADQFKMGKRTPRHRLAFGDLVFFETRRDKVSHVGIYIGHNEFIHASTSKGVIISGLGESYWTERYVGARRILE
jgi:cell wall-associated NlpC family hydrolase